MNPTTKRYLLSSATTFISVGVATLAVQLSAANPIMWTTTFWAAIGITVLRAAFKAVVESWSGQNTDVPTV